MHHGVRRIWSSGSGLEGRREEKQEGNMKEGWNRVVEMVDGRISGCLICNFKLFSPRPLVKLGLGQTCVSGSDKILARK